MQSNETEKLLYISLGKMGDTVDLLFLQLLSEALRGIFREIVREQSGERKSNILLEVRDATKGSLNLVIEPTIAGFNSTDSIAVAQTLINDINSIASESARSTMGAGLLAKYQSLIEIGQQSGRLVLQANGVQATIDSSTSIAFQAALKETPEPETLVAGHIESVNIHQKPWSFGLYTKFDQERIECRFDEPMLEKILQLMESKALVEVVGEGVFGPLGLTPSRIDLQETPRELVFSVNSLLSFRRSAGMVKLGESVPVALSRVREEQSRYE